jgi:hypothetical protein
MEKLTFSTFDYYLDQSDPDVLLLRRKDGRSLQRSARGVSQRGASSKPSRRIVGS